MAKKPTPTLREFIFYLAGLRDGGGFPDDRQTVVQLLDAVMESEGIFGQSRAGEFLADVRDTLDTDDDS